MSKYSQLFNYILLHPYLHFICLNYHNLMIVCQNLPIATNKYLPAYSYLPISVCQSLLFHTFFTLAF